MATNEPMLGIIGGTGLYQMDGLRDEQWRRVESPWGAPSDDVLTGVLEGVRVAFLPRHGRGHRIPPGRINYRANIDVLKRAGCTDVVSVSAVGSLREDLPPGTFVVVDQFIDRTFDREKSFFGAGLVAHVSMAHPVCSRLGDHLEEAARTCRIPVRRGGTYIVMEGPQFSTLAEARLYRQWGCDVVGMTNMPEAKLAREAELCYATVAMVTDFDCWHPDFEHVTVGEIMKVLESNAEHAKALVRRTASLLGARPDACPRGCDRALETALTTAPAARDPEAVAKVAAVAARVLNR